jgi:hypothetical protein
LVAVGFATRRTATPQHSLRVCPHSDEAAPPPPSAISPYERPENAAKWGSNHAAFMATPSTTALAMSARVDVRPRLTKPPRILRSKRGAIEPTSHGWNSTPDEPGQRARGGGEHPLVRVVRPRGAEAVVRVDDVVDEEVERLSADPVLGDDEVHLAAAGWVPRSGRVLHPLASTGCG